MSKQTVFRGAATALVTPLTPAGVDYDALGKLIDWQIGQGIDALVIAGTTGEGSTLTYDEHQEVIRYSVERAAGRVPIIAGSGSNDTNRAITLSKFSCRAGADALLVVTPYYNKATQKGLVAMYTAIADAVDKPIILYNVPSRTGVGIEPATYLALADHPNIVGIKEANGNISKIVETAALVGDKLDLYSGNDDQIVEICRRFFDGDVAGSARLQCELLPLINALFSEVNPIPVKAAMAELGWCENYLRLPLTPMEEEHWAKLKGIMRDKGVL